MSISLHVSLSKLTTEKKQQNTPIRGVGLLVLYITELEIAKCSVKPFNYPKLDFVHVQWITCRISQNRSIYIYISQLFPLGRGETHQIHPPPPPPPPSHFCIQVKLCIGQNHKLLQDIICPINEYKSKKLSPHMLNNSCFLLAIDIFFNISLFTIKLHTRQFLFSVGMMGALSLK